jgi:deoxyribose-phosphate aldolase
MYGVSHEEIRRLVAVIDYSEALTITSTEKDVREACEAAKSYGFRAVVSFPQHLGLIVDTLKGSTVRAQIPVGFPCGGTTTHVKCTEAEEGLRRGATDLDMVMNIAAFKAGNYKRVSEDIAAVMAVAKPFQVPFKVIIEVGALTDQEIVTAANLVVDAGDAHIISLIKETVGDRIGIKASGGVPSIEDGVAFMRAGATIVAMRRNLINQLEELGWERAST